MFDKLSDNLNFLMAEMRISADELSRRIDIPASTIKKIRNRYNPNPTLTTLLPLAKFFSISLGQLVGDEPLPDSRIQGLYTPNVDSACHLPLISWEETIAWPDKKQQDYLTIATENKYSENAYALTVEDDDWENLARGTLLLIDPLLTPAHRDFAIIYKEGQNIPSLKQILFDDEKMYLKPIIAGYNMAVFTSEYRLLGVVVEYKKHLRNTI